MRAHRQHDLSRHRRRAVIAVVGLLAIAATPTAATPARAAEGGYVVLPPLDGQADYQLGGDYPRPAGVTIVARDWFSGTAAPVYSICYVNAFQTQADEPGTTRPDEASAWPASVVLRSLGEDPNWPGEYLIDLSTATLRARAARHVRQMVATCDRKGFEAVEFDNLDSWTRFDGTDREGTVPFGRSDAIAYAELLTDHAHSLGLAVGQKNTPQLGRRVSRTVIGFDFVIAEQCGQYRECDAYRAAFGRRIIDIEYTDVGFRRACTAIGDASVIRRDLDLRTPASARYVYRAC